MTVELSIEVSSGNRLFEVLLRVMYVALGLMLIGSVLVGVLAGDASVGIVSAVTLAIPLVVMTFVLRAVARDTPIWEFHADKFVEAALFRRTEIPWTSVKRVRLSSTLVSGSTALAITPASGSDGEVVIDCARVIEPDALRRALRQLLIDCPVESIDVDVVLLYAYAGRVADRLGQTTPSDLLQKAARFDLRGVSEEADATGAELVLVAEASFLAGRPAVAKRWVGRIRSDDWDLSLCRALCERELGDLTGWRASAESALNASPPEVAPVLRHALGVA